MHYHIHLQVLSLTERLMGDLYYLLFLGIVDLTHAYFVRLDSVDTYSKFQSKPIFNDIYYTLLKNMTEIGYQGDNIKSNWYSLLKRKERDFNNRKSTKHLN